MRSRAALNPRKPFDGHDVHDVGQVLFPRPRAFSDIDVLEPARFMQRVLHRRAANARQRGDLVNRKIAVAAVFDFAGDDGEHGALAFRVLAAEIWRHDGRAAERAPSVARSLFLLVSQFSAAAWRELTGEFN
jgi:hypothetical protein